MNDVRQIAVMVAPRKLQEKMENETDTLGTEWTEYRMEEPEAPKRPKAGA